MADLDRMSFSSPYRVEALDQIPTSILQFLTLLGPFLSQLAKLCEIIMWKRTGRHAILLVLIWNIICLFSWQVTAALPSLILIIYIREWFQIKTAKARREQLEQQRQQERESRMQLATDEDDRSRYLRQLEQQQREESELISRKIRPEGQVSLDETLNDLVTIYGCVCNFKEQWQLPASQFSVLSGLMYIWPIWFVACAWLGTGPVLGGVGTLLVASASPQCHLMWNALKQNRILKYILTSFWAYGVAFTTTTVTYFFFSDKKHRKGFKGWLELFWKRSKSEKGKAISVLEDHQDLIQENKGKRSEMIFQFEIYENQRWWLGVSWTNNMMPSERAPWTDNQLRPIKSKESFKLPESTAKVTQYEKNNKTIEKTTTKVWSWVDGDWWVDMTAEKEGKIDQLGWEYGNNAWKQLSGTPGIQTFTRRRRWCRRARLVERETDIPLESKNKKD